MQKFDLLIIGGGMVGLTLALAVRQRSELTVAVVETTTPQALGEQPEVRVSAINLASQHIFANLGVWEDIQTARAQAYQQMHVWDKDGFGHIDFDHLAVEQPQLGWIIENNVIRNALWQKAQTDNGITLLTEQPIQSIAMGESEVFASFEGALPIVAKAVVGADGANSWLRQQFAFPMTFRDYEHHAIVATVDCQQSHNNTAWQVFLPTGPLALLPLFNDKQCSIVWSTSPDEAERLQNLDASSFAKELTAATDGKLGSLTLASERFSYPLTMRLAHEFVNQRVVLIGDAAHTIHPLAGQGVNLGLLDAAALADTFAEQALSQQSLTDSKQLNRYNRWRRSEATEMVAAMEAIKQLFAPQHTVLKVLRGMGMGLFDHLSPLKNLLMRQALGIKDHLPTLAKYRDPLSPEN